MDEGPFISGVLGYDAGSLRAEGEVGYRRTEAATLEVEAVSSMVNLIADLPLSDTASIYVGGGLGAAFVEAEDGSDDTVFAYQFLAGLEGRVTENVSLLAGYRLWTTSDLDFGGVSFDVGAVHGLEVGLRFDL